MEIHRVEVGERDVAARTLAAAFVDDPVWGWAFGDTGRRSEQLREFWGLALDGALDHGWVWSTDGHEAVSLWIPPGEPELTEPAAYLESSNPANLDRYRSVGFERFGTFELPQDGPVVDQMWRPAR